MTNQSENWVACFWRRRRHKHAYIKMLLYASGREHFLKWRRDPDPDAHTGRGQDRGRDSTNNWVACFPRRSRGKHAPVKIIGSFLYASGWKRSNILTLKGIDWGVRISVQGTSILTHAHPYYPLSLRGSFASNEPKQSEPINSVLYASGWKHLPSDILSYLKKTARYDSKWARSDAR